MKTSTDPLVLAIDQGTSSSRCVILDTAAATVAGAQQEFPQEYPQPGWVEHDLDEIWQATTATLRDVVDEVGVDLVAGLGVGLDRLGGRLLGVRDRLRGRGLRVESGVFQAMMEVDITNNGPVTILLDSEKLF